MTLIEIARLFRDVRRAQGRSQTSMSRALGCAQTTISALERGAIPSRVGTLLDYARLLDLDPAPIAEALVRDLGLGELLSESDRAVCGVVKKSHEVSGASE